MTELAYIRKRALRGKHRKVRIEDVANPLNIAVAVRESRRHKERNKGVLIYDRKASENIEALSAAMLSRTYHTSEGHECMRRCPCGKTRKLHKLPYYPDHVAHHALMQQLMPSLMKALYVDSSASVKGRGMMYAKNRVERWIDEHKHCGRIFYVKLDFTKFYENINQERIYECMCRMYGNVGIRYLLKEVITACPQGLGIGLYPIQTLTNHYMSILCRKVCAEYNVKVEIYCDDIVVLGEDKKQVWAAVNYIKRYADEVLQQPLHTNIGMQIVDEHHFLDFVGFRFYFGHTLLRKKMKQKFIRKMARLTDPMRRYQVGVSYRGWLMHCSGFNLWTRTMNMDSFKDFNMPEIEKRDADGKRIFDGQRISASYFEGREIVFRDVEFDVKSIKHSSGKCTVVSVEENGRKFKFFTNNRNLAEQLRWCKHNEKFPFRATLTKANNGGTPDYRLS